MSIDATHAYRGFRNQALYSLYRILSSPIDEDLIFQPEGNEDLTILDKEHHVLEEVQVKDYTTPLTLSNFEPDKKLSFFNRIIPQIMQSPTLKVTITSFGEVGTELHRALEQDGNQRDRVATKISNHGFVTLEDAKFALSRIGIERVSEAHLEQIIYSKLSEMCTGINPHNSFDLLMYWLYRCSERKTCITRSDVIEQINNVGRYLKQTAAHHAEWEKFIVPIEDRAIDEGMQDQLRDEFYQGISTRYEHILANLDIPRVDKLQEIADKFKKYRVVIVHGASGQGKSTLALRFLKEYVPEKWRFRIHAIENRSHALSLAQALLGHADAIGIPVMVYMDVSPHDRDWAELVKQLSSHPHIQVLVTVREEDWKRASVSGHELQFAEIELELDKPEASRLYEAFSRQQGHSPFLNFEEAWRHFGEKGPLLEFVYLLTQGTTLRERLVQQIQRLALDDESGKLLELLYMVATASAYGARILVKPMVRMLQIPVPGRMLSLLEKEYLIRMTEGQLNVQGLHPVRSEILVEVLSDSLLQDWSEIAHQSIPFIHPEDIEIFLMHVFSRRKDDIPQVLDALRTHSPTTWTAVAGIIRALIWLGISRYVDENEKLLKDISKKFGQGNTFVLDFDIADAIPGSSESIINLMSAIPPQGKQEILQFRSRQTDKKRVFALASEWLARTRVSLEAPSTLSDWKGLSYSGFWAARLQVSSNLTDYFSSSLLKRGFEELSIEAFGDLTLATHEVNPQLLVEWMSENGGQVRLRFQEQTFTTHLEEDHEMIRAHFVVEKEKYDAQFSPITTEKPQNQNDVHLDNISRLNLLRKLFPTYTYYGSKGYGHRVPGFEELPNDTIKRIEGRYLSIDWLTTVNGIFNRLVLNKSRVRSWQEYANQVVMIRKYITTRIEDLQQALQLYFKKKTLVEPLQHINSEGLEDIRNILKSPPIYPSVAVDEWGLVKDTNTAYKKSDDSSSFIVPHHALAYKAFNLYKESFDELITSFSNFFNQCLDVLFISPIKGRVKERKKKQILEAAVKKGWRDDFSNISTINLATAFKALRTTQQQFRKHFQHLFKEDELFTLEQSEIATLSNFFPMWFDFAFRPEFDMRDAAAECRRNYQETMRDFLQRLDKNLALSSDADLELTRIESPLTYKGESVVWILANDKLARPVNTMERVNSSLEKTLSMSTNSLFQWFTVNLKWEYIVVLPLVAGRIATQIAWEVNLPALLSHSPEKSARWRMFPMTISEDIPVKLGLSTWKHPILNTATKLGTLHGQLYSLVNHHYELDQCPVDDLMAPYVRSYLEGLLARTANIYSELIVLLQEIYDTCRNGLTDDPLNESLQAVVNLLPDYLDLINPPEDILVLSDLEQWQTNLSHGLTQVGQLSSHLITFAYREEQGTIDPKTV